MITITEADCRAAGEPVCWNCIDCGFDTYPGARGAAGTAAELNKQGFSKRVVNSRCELYTVRDAVWKKAGMKPFGGALCIGCLEGRIGRKLKPKDFSDHVFNILPGTPRLLSRRKSSASEEETYILKPEHVFEALLSSKLPEIEEAA